MDEGDIDHSRYGWGSEEWVHDSQIVVEETTKRNMSVSFTSGTNWSNANLPTIDADHPGGGQGARRRRARICAPVPRAAAPLPRIDLDAAPQAGTASRASRRGPRAARSSPSSPPGSWTSRRRRRPGRRLGGRPHRTRCATRPWTGPRRRRRRGGSSPSGCTAPARPRRPRRSVNYTVNYVDPDGAQAVIDYWDSVVLTPELREQIARNPRAQMYMDSLELSTYGAGGLFWGRTVAEEFRTRRGYDIAPWLPFLTRTVPMMAVGTIYHHEPLRPSTGHGREGPLRLRAHPHRPLHREHAAPVRGVPARRTG